MICKWFAWYPVRIQNKWYWMSYVQRSWNEDLNHWCDSSGWSGSDGGWEYTITKMELNNGKI